MACDGGDAPRWLAGRFTVWRRRGAGFWCFILSNALWIAWGWHDGAYALIAMQIGLLALNIRGARNNQDASA